MMRSFSRKLIAAVALALALTGAVAAQRASIRTADGYLFIQNGKGISFVCEVKGKDIKPLTNLENPAFMADGMLIQIISVPGSNYEPTGNVESAKLLEAHRKWESDYLATVFGPVVSDAEAVDVSGRRTLFWSFKRPKHAAEFDRDSFLTTLIGRDVFGVNSPVKVGADLKETRRRLIEVVQSLRISMTPFDVTKLADAIRAGKNPFDK